MNIERISDNQIRCTLNKEDLLERKLNISELAYGSEKAKELFTDICKMAFKECNFETEDIPLMIEAIPISHECLVLVVTKVNDPEELDVRFSNFTNPDSQVPFAHLAPEEKNYADEVISCFEHLSELLGDPLASKFLDSIKGNDGKTSGALYKVYSFSSLEEVIRLSSIIHKIYNGSNTLYKDSSNDIYYLVLNISEHTAEEFNKVCNIVAEYGNSNRPSTTDVRFFEEHFDVIVRDKAVQVLYKL